MSIIWALVAITAAASPDADARLLRLITLYNRACLKAFPDDKAVEELMAAEAARELTPEEVKVTMRDDPARAWLLKDGNATVWLEYPPYHSCSVRWSAPEIGNLEPYRTLADAYESSRPGFTAMKPWDADQDVLHIHAVGEQRILPDGGGETLFVIDQHITDPKRRAAGETGVSVRFVHQLAPPPRTGAK